MIYRYCGDVEIQMEALGRTEEDYLLIGGRVIVGQDWWEFDNVIVKSKAFTPTSWAAAAHNACHFASLYGSNYGDSPDEGEIPPWAPPSDFADRVNDALDISPEGYVIRSEK